MAHAVKHTADILGSPHNEEITDYKGLLLSLIKNNNIQKKNLVDFISSELYRYDNSLKPVMAWAEEDQEKRNNWATHCPLVQKIWMEFVDKIKDICYGEAAVVIENMSAPSGPLRSRCTFVWHYPTNNVSLPRFAHVLNPASETMKTQNVSYTLQPLFYRILISLSGKLVQETMFEHKTWFQFAWTMVSRPMTSETRASIGTKSFKIGLRSKKLASPSRPNYVKTIVLFLRSASMLPRTSSAVFVNKACWYMISNLTLKQRCSPTNHGYHWS